MPEEVNGHNRPSRLDRIERAVEALIDGHERLLASHNQLLTAQVVMSDSINTLIKTVDKLAAKVESHEDRIQVLIDSQLRTDESIRKLVERQPGQM